MNMPQNIGARLKTAAGGGANATAGGTGDTTEATLSYVARGGARSGKLIIHYRATLAEGKKLSLAASIKHANTAGGSGAAAYGGSIASAVVATGGTGGSIERGTLEIDVNFDRAHEYVAAVVTPDLDAANTDTCTIESIWVLGGFDRNPVTRSA